MSAESCKITNGAQVGAMETLMQKIVVCNGRLDDVHNNAGIYNLV
jgi:hypothetical protein